MLVVGAGTDSKRGRGQTHNTAVFRMLARSGDVMSKIVPNAKTKTLRPIIKENIDEGSTISSDEWCAYKTLKYHGYKHGTVKHGNGVYVKGIHHTNSIEGFWSQLKRSIRGTHVHVSKQHLAKYLGEFEYRYNMRSNPSLMFDRLLASF